MTGSFEARRAQPPRINQHKQTLSFMDRVRNFMPQAVADRVLRRGLGGASFADQNPFQPSTSSQANIPGTTPETALGRNQQEQEHQPGTFLIIFGPPGSGKTVAGEYLEATYGYTSFDADMYRSDAEKERLAHGEPSTQESRDQRFTDLMSKIRELRDDHEKLAIVSWLPVRYHELYEAAFPDATFIFMEAPQEEREERIQRRTTHFIKPDYNIQLTRTWGDPQVAQRRTVVNDGSMEDLHAQLDALVREVSGK